MTIRFTVSDTGIGIPEEARERIFESFVQAEGSTTRKYGGTGIGLTVSYELVKLMGGKLNVDSQVGVGSHFAFDVTFRITDDVMDDQNPTTKEIKDSIPQPLRLTVLLAEDNTVNQFIAGEMLSVMECKTRFAENGHSALEQFEAGSVDVILMDCEMPGMDGFEATMRIREIETNKKLAPTPIVALTAHASNEDRKRTASVGMNGFLSKPFTLENLHKALTEVTTSSGSNTKTAGPEVKPK